MIKIKVSNGNLKIGRDTLIFNMAPAHNCISDKKGYCRVSNICYAKRSEIRYKQVLPFRMAQEKIWRTVSSEDFIENLKTIIKRKRIHKIKFIRFNESGDFKGQSDINKLIKIARGLPKITIYGYTTRFDLNYDKRPDNLIINGSGFMIDNNFKATAFNEIDHNNDTICPGNCRGCHLCKKSGNKVIKVIYH
jgi:hypothetical protein